MLLPRVTAAPSPGEAPCVLAELLLLLNFSVSWRMDGEIEERGVEEPLLASAVGRPAVAAVEVVVAEILETFLDTLTLRVAKGCSALLGSGGRATPAASKSSDLCCWSSLLLAPQDPNFLKETLRYTAAFFLSLSAIVHVFLCYSSRTHIVTPRISRIQAPFGVVVHFSPLPQPHGKKPPNSKHTVMFLKVLTKPENSPVAGWR